MNANSPLDRTRAAERRWSLSRRHFLHGLGACIALPALPSLLPKSALASEVAAGATAEATAIPRRMVFVMIPNGVNLAQWWPQGKGTDFTLASSMEPLAAIKDQIQVISGLDQINATPGKDGAGDHARASASLLTGVRAKKTAGADIHLGISVDQVAAQHVGHLTRFPSLELTCDGVRNAGNCDSGYSCAYQYNIAWRSDTTPMPPEPNPRLVFERLFGEGSGLARAENLKRRLEREHSLLDFIRDDARSLGQKLSPQDNRKLDEYLTSVREIEQRITDFEKFGDLPNPAVKTPRGIPDQFEARMQVIYDMIVLAFQTDSTRIATLILSHEGSNRSFPEIGIAQGHHDLSHHRGVQKKLDLLAQIDKHHINFFGQFLEKLAKLKDSDGSSILHNSMIVYAGGNADGNTHTHVNLPIILAGSGGGKLHAGRFLKVPSMPMSNMYLEMLAHLGVEGVDHFGDANNRRVNI